MILLLALIPLGLFVLCYLDYTSGGHGPGSGDAFDNVVGSARHGVDCAGGKGCTGEHN